MRALLLLLSELPETKPEKINFARPYIVLTKYDGCDSPLLSS